MYLKRLSIQGFKSFANRTAFDYSNGVTAVVGPNGSGKSNVSDAIRWVLGEQSSRLLRAKKQEDVIFAGTGNRAAVGMAEVLLTLDNEERWLPLDFAEIEIGRRVYRNGDSEYLLNGSRVRLRDVTDLLMKGDVGQNSYSIMGQGLVDEVLSMSPDERRSFLDEAADVKRFRMKVKEAQDRLAANRENTEKIALVVSEIAPRLAQLSRQAARAADHRRLSAELAELLRVSYAYRWHEAENALVRARASLDQRSAEDTAAATRVSQLREQIRALGDEIRKRREAIARRDSAKSQLEQRISAAEQAIALEGQRHGMVTQRRDEVLREAEALEQERAALAATDSDEGRSASMATEVEEAKQHAQQCRLALEAAERDYGRLRRSLRELRDSADADDRRINAIESDAGRAASRAEELAREAEQAVGRRRQLLAELRTYGQRFAEARLAVLQGQDGVESARFSAENAQNRLRRLQDDVRAFETANNDELRDLDYLEGRLEALRRVHAEHEGVAAGTRNVLQMGARGDGARPELDGVVGLLAHELRVPQGLETAINAALDHRLHAIIVEDEDAAFEAVRALRGAQLGRAQFLPIQGMRYTRAINLQKERGVVGVASRLVRCERHYQDLVDTLLGRVIVVEDAAAGQRMIQRGLGAVVTLDGTFIDPSGIISGGATGAEEGVFARQRELDELPGRIEELRERGRVAAEQLATAHEAMARMQEELDDAQAAYDEVRRAVESARAELERERDRLHRLRREMDASRSRELQIGRERVSRGQAAAEAGETLRELKLRRDERHAALSALEGELGAATEHRETALKAVSEASARLAALDGERRTLAALREQHEKALRRLTEQVASRRAQAESLAAEAALLDQRLTQLRRDLETARAEQAQQGDDTAPDRDELSRLENHERQVQDELNDAQAALLQLDRRRLDIEAEVERAAGYVKQLRVEMEREGLAPAPGGQIVPVEELAPADTAGEPEATPAIQGGAELDIAATLGRIEELRRQIRRLGPINDEAPEDFDELQERHAFLSAQLNDLEEAESQLREAITELNEEIRVRFASTFEQVNRSFGEYFQAFFGGGSANLALTDPENIAEAGIEIEAQPPGKRLRSLSLLSGGERSLTAVALLFALLTANPAPFCVLDEVDAALDEANVGRFTAALKQLAEKTQFLVVTHNRRTVEVADAIYGVSMMRDGVSKVLSLRIGDLPQN